MLNLKRLWPGFQITLGILIERLFTASSCDQMGLARTGFQFHVIFGKIMRNGIFIYTYM